MIHAGAVPEPPAKGKPEEFTGASGSFRTELISSSDIVDVKQPFPLTIRIVAVPGTTVHKKPGRPNLSLYKEYVDQFTIEEPVPAEREVDEHTWEFYYRLEALSEDTTEIPAFRFSYFDPLPEPGRYKSAYSEKLPLTVLPKRNDEDPVAPLAGPESLYVVVPADRTTARYGPTVLPPIWAMIVLGTIPPLVCLVWFWVWRRLNPDAVRQAGKRRSRAAQEALQSVGKCKSVKPLEQVLTRFLQQRFDLAITAPTPLEAMTHLMRVGVSLEAVQRTGEVYRDIAAARFSPASANESLEADVRQLIVTLENDPCRALLSC